MFRLIKYFVLLLLAVTVTANKDSCLPIQKDCTFYTRCLEEAIPCGPNGYALRYGLPYCTKFFDNFSKFSAKGQLWIISTCYCLQSVLVPVANRSVSINCDEIYTFAFSSHSGCYTERGNSICDLPMRDWNSIFYIVKNELKNLEAWKQIAQVLKACVLADIY